MRNRELMFFNLVAVLFAGIAGAAFVLCWPFAKLIQLRERIVAWAETLGEPN